MMRLLCTIFLVATWCALASAAAADAKTDSAFSAEEFPSRLAANVRTLTAALADELASTAARQELLSLQQAYLSTLATFSKDDDLEIRLRVVDSLDDALLEIRVGRMMASLPADQADKLVRFRKAQGWLFNEILSSDWSRRAKAMEKLDKLADPQMLAEPLVTMSLRHPDPALVTQAAFAAARMGYDSQSLLEAMIEVIVQQDPGRSRYYRNYDETINPSEAALSALRQISSPRAAPILLSLLVSTTNSNMDYERQMSLAEAMADTGEIRAVPVLVGSLAGTSSYSWSYPDGSGTTSIADYSFYVLLRVTGQSQQDYGFLICNNYGNGRYNIGFKDEKARRSGYDRMKQWWTAHKDEAPFKGIEPLTARPLGSRNSQRAAKATSGPASAPSSSPASAPASAPASRPAPQFPPSLAGVMVRYVKPLAAQCGSANLAGRQSAQRSLAAIQDTLLLSMLETVRSDEPRLRDPVVEVLGDFFCEASIQSALCHVPAHHAAKLQQLLQESPKAARDMFSLTGSVKLEAIKALQSRPDPNALAEPLLLMAFKDPSPHIRQAAAALAASGRYRSDETVDMLTTALQTANNDDWSRAYYNNDSSIKGTLDAITKIGSSRATPALLGMMLQQQNGFERSVMLVDPLAATGDKAMIPTLIENLGNANIRSTHSSGKKTITIAACDPPLLLLLRLTAQDAKAYSLETMDNGPSKMFGFKDDKTRQDAIKKFKEWWAANKDHPPYKDLKPIGVQAAPQSEEDQ